MGDEVKKSQKEIEEYYDRHNSVVYLLRIKDAKGEILKQATKKEIREYNARVDKKKANPGSANKQEQQQTQQPQQKPEQTQQNKKPEQNKKPQQKPEQKPEPEQPIDPKRSDKLANLANRNKGNQNANKQLPEYIDPNQTPPNEYTDPKPLPPGFSYVDPNLIPNKPGPEYAVATGTPAEYSLASPGPGKILDPTVAEYSLASPDPGKITQTTVGYEGGPNPAVIYDLASSTPQGVDYRSSAELNAAPVITAPVITAPVITAPVIPIPIPVKNNPPQVIPQVIIPTTVNNPLPPVIPPPVIPPIRKEMNLGNLDEESKIDERENRLLKELKRLTEELNELERINNDNSIQKTPRVIKNYFENKKRLEKEISAIKLQLNKKFKGGLRKKMKSRKRIRKTHKKKVKGKKRKTRRKNKKRSRKA